jgi:hypothetical protein
MIAFLHIEKRNRATSKEANMRPMQVSSTLVIFALTVCFIASGCVHPNNSGGNQASGTYQYDGTQTDGSHYVGSCLGDKPHGYGTYTWTDGHKYVGEFSNGKKHGQGTLTWPDGMKYVGEWRDDKRNGQGTHTWPDGKKYVGEWRDDKMYGQGRMTLPDGTVKEGMWSDGEYVGQVVKE